MALLLERLLADNADTRAIQDAPAQVSLFVLFIILAFIPGYKGFAISESNENGKTTDADFFYLMQSSLMSALGNFSVALPLLLSMRASRPSRYFWAFTILGILSALISVIMYPYTHTGWSTAVAFVGTVASAASVLVLAVATSKGRTAEEAENNAGESKTKDFEDRNGKSKTE